MPKERYVPTSRNKTGPSRFAKGVTAEKRRGMEDTSLETIICRPKMAAEYDVAPTEHRKADAGSVKATPPRHTSGKGNGTGKGFHGK